MAAFCRMSQALCFGVSISSDALATGLPRETEVPREVDRATTVTNCKALHMGTNVPPRLTAAIRCAAGRNRNRFFAHREKVCESSEKMVHLCECAFEGMA